MSKDNCLNLSDDDFTDEELANIYGIHSRNISCREDIEDSHLQYMATIAELRTSQQHNSLT